MTDSSVLPASFYERLRRAPSASTVDGSLPVLFFGDYVTARVATVALNPSNQEYTTAPTTAQPTGLLLNGTRQRFATLDSLGATNRQTLTDAQCEEAVRWMRGYFGAEKPVYRYFGHLERFLEGAGSSYRNGSAAHLDVVQESTLPVWSGLDDAERGDLLREDVPFLLSQLTVRRLEALFCNGRTVSDILRTELGVIVRAEGRAGKLRWWTGRLTANDHDVSVAGWNIPLNQATGLNGDGEREFGRFLAQELGLAR